MSEATEQAYDREASALRARLSSIPSAVELPASSCFENGRKHLEGRRIVVTGAGAGFGREFVLKACSYGAKVFLSDLNPEAVQQVVRLVEQDGKGQAIAYSTKCDVRSWDDQLAMFKEAKKALGEIDVVVPNAGVGETSPLVKDEVLPNGDPAPPKLLTIDVNLVGVIYTVKLAFFFLRQNPATTGKAIVFVGSLASLSALPRGPAYGAAKHGVLGLFRSLNFDAAAYNINANIICPWFCDTAIIKLPNRIGLFGLPLCKLDDVVAAMIQSTADPDFTGNTLAVDATGILSIPFEAYAPGPGGYYEAFHKRAVDSIKFEAQVIDSIKIVKHIASATLSSRTGQILIGSIAVATLGILRSKF